MLRPLALGSLLLAGLLVACAADTTTEEEVPEEADGALSGDLPVSGPDMTDAPNALAPVGYDSDATDLLDVRGVGDSAFSKTHERDPLPAQIGAELDKFDGTGLKIKGDLSFMNWESVVGNRCDQFSKPYVAGSSYAFLSRPENLQQVYDRGINLLGFSNNHSRDCSNGAGESTSSRISMASLGGMADNDWLLAGIASTQDAVRTAQVRTFTIKGRKIKVAFGDIYTGRGSCPLSTCEDDADALMKSIRDADADFRILALHSQSSQPALVKNGTEFIQRYNGDVVFGHGPHVWKPVRVLEKANGKKGVFFESLGNFLHPGCAVQPRNVIGRALYDENLVLKQVQLLPVQNNGRGVVLSSADPGTVPANVRWSPTGRDRGVYANIKP